MYVYMLAMCCLHIYHIWVHNLFLSFEMYAIGTASKVKKEVRFSHFNHSLWIHRYV